MRWWRRPRTTGFPSSANGASSMHLWWEPCPAAVEVAVDLEVAVAPAVDRLYFWALQAGFADGSGRRYGAGHLGLQWHPAHPGATAVCWGGYGPDGRELSGSPSALPSATGNPNTRDLPWVAGRPYRLRIARDADGWTGWVDDVPVRTLLAGGDRLVGLVVWSEVFARCDDPSTVVRWSGFDPAPDALRASYQSQAAGGCANTTSRPAASAVEQVTATDRTVADGGRVSPTGS